jgi:hypothetical protein
VSASEESERDRDVVRRLRATDAAAYRAVMLEAYATYPSAFTSTVVGAAGLDFETRERTHHKATLFGMAVTASAHRSGFGRLVQLTVTEGNGAASHSTAPCSKIHMGCDLGPAPAGLAH